MRTIWNRTAKLFGVRHGDETDGRSMHQAAWLERRKRLLNRRCGNLSCDVKSSEPKQTTDLSKESFKNQLPDYKQFISRPKRHTAEKDTNNRDVHIVSRSSDSTLDNNLNTVSDKVIEQVVKKTKPVEPPVRRATSAIATTHAPLMRATSDTAIHQAPKYPRESQNDDSQSYRSYDFTDFDAKESIVKLLNDVLSRHQPKRAFGMGVVGNLLSRKFRKDLTYNEVNSLYSFNDHRPYFTYWVTTVQILIMIITLITYGFGTFGLSQTLVKDTVYVSSLYWKREGYYQHDNIWLGPKPQDLIHLGAKFTPCMRRDSLIYKEIQQDHQGEKLTGCCIRNDESGCLQTRKEDCSQSSKWHSWNESNIDAPNIGNRRRRSGPVCGQDPQYCLKPASTHPHDWPDDISKWPLCQEKLRTSKPLHHMSCDLVGRPCCIGIYGQCLITHSEHCHFLGGTFHPEATLCSQVSCMEDVCGMVPFYARDYPDQFYRLFTAIFLHAGLIHLALTIVLQYYVMRDIERLLGSTRMAIIYILPGVAGYLASAAFVPYHTQVGPSGSQLAILACLMAETINSWHLLESPMRSLLKLISIAFGLFILGLLPWVDNYAHIFGFLVGLMLALALTPYLTPFNDAYSKRIKVIQIWICLILVVLTFILLSLPLYVFPLYKCSWCQYLDCWPLAPNWCENQDIKVNRLDIF